MLNRNIIMGMIVVITAIVRSKVFRKKWILL